MVANSTTFDHVAKRPVPRESVVKISLWLRMIQVTGERRRAQTQAPGKEPDRGTASRPPAYFRTYFRTARGPTSAP